LADAVALRVAGALHSFVLERLDPALVAIFPPQRAAFDPVAGAEVVGNALRKFRDRVADYLQRPPQTNEIGRSAVLLGGFATVAARTGLPLALHELGASAGLNMLWSRYRYELGTNASWGDPASPVIIRCDWRGTPPALPPGIDVVSWRGCDVSPIHVAAPHAATRLMSYVWADQRERLQRLQAAIELARSAALEVEEIDAVSFAERELAEGRAGATTVIYHSIFWQYLPETSRAALRAFIEAAGARATEAAPLAWLAFEVPAAWGGQQLVKPQLKLTIWPGGERITLAEAHPHGQYAHWFGPAA
jgi:hypothetical protein